MTQRFLFAIAIVVVTALPGTLSAQDTSPAAPIIIRGVAPRPAVSVYVARSRPSPRLEDLHAALAREIPATVAHAPF